MIIGRWERILITAIGSVVLAFLILPMVVVVLASFDPSEFFTFPPRALSWHWYSEVLSDEDWRGSILFSLFVSTITAACAGILGGAAGIALARSRQTTRRILTPLFVAPLIVPTIILAIAYYGIALELRQVGTVGAFVVADTLFTAPLVALLVRGAAMRFDPSIENASLSCGASRMRTLVKVTVPMAWPTILAGSLFAFLLSLDEVVLSIFLVAPGRTPLAVRMFLNAQAGTTPPLTAVATLLIVASMLVAAGLAIASRRRSEYGLALVRNDLGNNE